MDDPSFCSSPLPTGNQFPPIAAQDLPFVMKAGYLEKRRKGKTLMKILPGFFSHICRMHEELVFCLGNWWVLRLAENLDDLIQTTNWHCQLFKDFGVNTTGEVLVVNLSYLHSMQSSLLCHAGKPLARFVFLTIEFLCLNPPCPALGLLHLSWLMLRLLQFICSLAPVCCCLWLISVLSHWPR